jgi:hypothetical protein
MAVQAAALVITQAQLLELVQRDKEITVLMGIKVQAAATLVLAAAAAALEQLAVRVVQMLAAMAVLELQLTQHGARRHHLVIM